MCLSTTIIVCLFPPYMSLSFCLKCLVAFLLGFPGGSEDKASACNARDPGLISGLGRSSRGGNGNPLLYSCLGNPMDRGAWWATSPGGHKESDMTEHAQGKETEAQ